LDVPHLGPCLRMALWNIERGLELDYIELQSETRRLPFNEPMQLSNKEKAL